MTSEFEETHTDTIKELGKRIGEICHEKNTSYGDAVNVSAAVMKHLYPEGVPVEKYHQMLVTVRIIDKLLRLANDASYNAEDPALDIAGYGLCLSKVLRDNGIVG